MPEARWQIESVIDDFEDTMIKWFFLSLSWHLDPLLPIQSN